tara:strand:- start:38 stop:316 length:279 start_codon:yes stop_codon:yes gene_type:complete
MNDLFSRYATTRQMVPIIGIGDKTLYRLRQLGILEEGKHYRLKNPLNPKSHILYDVEAVITELNRTDLEKKLIETDNLENKQKKINKKVISA